MCADVYAGNKLRSIGDLADGFLRFAAQHPSKPIDDRRVRGGARLGRSAGVVAAGRGGDVQGQPADPAVMYFESDPTDNEGANQQFELSDDPSALAAFQELAKEPYFNTRAP